MRWVDGDGDGGEGRGWLCCEGRVKCFGEVLRGDTEGNNGPGNNK